METGFFFSLILDPVEDSHWVLSGQIGEKDAISKSVTGFPGGSDGKASAYNAGDPDLIPGSGRSPGKGNGNPLQYSCLENPMDGVAWWATVHGVAKSWTRLSDFTFTVLLGSCFILGERLSCVVGLGVDELKGSNYVTNNCIWLRPARDNVYIFRRVCPSLQVWGLPGGCLV